MLEQQNLQNKDMAKISLKEIIDDILLLVRNNYISESEDLSREQIHLWVRAYRKQIWKEELDRRKALLFQNNLDVDQLIDNEFIFKIETGPMELEELEENKGPENTKRTVETLKDKTGMDVLDNAESSILAIHDQNGENIQYMNHIRKFYHNYRKYTYGDMTAYYKDDGHIYVQGIVDKGQLKYIYVLAMYENQDDNEEDDDVDEDNIMIPAWMVPGIKERILKNELPFMLNRPSDDSNNATLASVKPHGPQDDEE